jgi:hypothetical protein
VAAVRVETVDSSVLRAVGYDPSTQTLVLAFTSGAVYTYADVPPEVHAGLLAAPSLGRFFSAEIRDRFPTARLGDLA